MHLQTKMNKLLYISKKWLCLIWKALLCWNTVISQKRRRISIYFRNKPLKPVDAADKLFGYFFLISSDLYCIVLNVLNVFKILHWTTYTYQYKTWWSRRSRLQMQAWMFLEQQVLGKSPIRANMLCSSLYKETILC